MNTGDASNKAVMQLGLIAVGYKLRLSMLTPAQQEVMRGVITDIEDVLVQWLDDTREETP